MKYFFSNFKCYVSYISNKHNKRHSKIVKLFFSFILFPLWFFKYFFKVKEGKEYKYKLAAVMIAKNEASYIIEWIEFHKNLGFDKFIIYDNDSDDDLKSVLQKHIDIGILDYYYYPGKCKQNYAYNDAIKKYKKKIKYMIMIDGDEFLYPTNPNDSIYEIVDNIMTKNHNVGGLTISWLCFGSNGHINRPDGLVISNYTRRGEDTFSHNFKSIVNPRKVAMYFNPHYAIYKHKYYGFNTSLKRIDICPMKDITEMDLSLLRINHYFTKSKEEFIKKRNRGMADNGNIRSLKEFELHDVNDIEDDHLLIYAPIIEKELNSNK